MATDSQVRALDGAAGCRASLLPSSGSIFFIPVLSNLAPYRACEETEIILGHTLRKFE